MPKDRGCLTLPGRGVIHMDPHHVSSNSLVVFATPPFFSSLLVPNESSDARDHCANERTFLSWIKLAVYLDVVAVAIIINFHFKETPTELELKMSRPMGIIFWCLSLLCIVNGYANYIRTVARYTRRRAMVQYGGKTQILFFIICAAIIATCAVFIVSSSQARQ